MDNHPVSHLGAPATRTAFHNLPGGLVPSNDSLISLWPLAEIPMKKSGAWAAVGVVWPS